MGNPAQVLVISLKIGIKVEDNKKECIMKGKSQLYILILAFLMLLLLVIRIIISPDMFADYSNYIKYEHIDINRNFLYIEGISNIVINLPTIFIEKSSIHSGIILFSIINIIALSTFLIYNQPIKIEGAILIIAIFSPLLVYVTLRAAIPYLLISTIILYKNINLLRCLLFIAISLLFHASTLLVFFAFIIYYILIYSKVDLLKVKKSTLFLFFTLLYIFILLNTDNILIFIYSLFNIFGFTFDKLSYLDASIVNRGSMHIIYFLIVTALLTFFRDYFTINFKNYNLIMSFYIIFLLLEMSPVVAYRYSLFFLIPIIYTFDLEKMNIYINIHLKYAILSIFSIIIFFYSLKSLILIDYQ